MATALAAAVFTLTMGLLTNLPSPWRPASSPRSTGRNPSPRCRRSSSFAAIPLTSSISAGIGLGVLGFVAVMAARGRARDVHPVMWLLVPPFLAFFASDWLSANVF